MVDLFDDQYFDLPFLPHEQDEVFVDAGCFDGLTVRNIITSQKPKLAISIYHKKEDIWELPGLLLEMNPEYRFYLRHYSLREAETVLYAV